jgi:hypothetical protein
MDKARSATRSRFDLFMKSLLAQDYVECKEIISGEKITKELKYAVH